MRHDLIRPLTNRPKLLQRSAAVSGLAVAATGLAPSGVAAQEGTGGLLQRVLERGNVVVGTDSANPPWHFENEDGELVGFDAEMARVLAAGLFGDPEKVEFVIQAADARIPNLQADKVDIVFQFMTVNAQRAQLVDFTIPYYREAFTLMFPANSEYSTAEELEGQGASIAILQNPTAPEYVHLMVPDAEVMQFDSVANSILALDSGRVVATAIDVSTGQWKIAQDPNKYKLAEEAYLPQSYSAAVKPGDQRWLNYVNTVLYEAMNGVGFDAYSASFQTYFGVAPPPPQAGFPSEFR
jgi:polar amino acid transport system substrate-binding protein